MTSITPLHFTITDTTTIIPHDCPAVVIMCHIHPVHNKIFYHEVIRP